MAMTLRLTPADQAVLDALVEEEHLSAQEVVRRAILERAARKGHQARVDAAFAVVEDEYSDLLEQLRQA